MVFCITDIIDLLVIFQFMLLAIVLIFTRRGQLISNRLLAIFFFIQVFCIFGSVIGRHWEWFVRHCPHAFHLTSSLLMLLGPCLFLYAKSLFNHRFTLKKLDSLHLLPAILHFSFFFIRFHRFSAETKRSLLSHQHAVLTELESRILDGALFLSLIIYSLLVLYQWIKYRKAVKQYYSSNRIMDKNWLILMISGFILIWFTEMTDYYVGWITGKHTPLSQIIHPIVFILATGIVIKSLLQPPLFNDFEIYRKYSKYPLSESQKKYKLETLVRIMEDKKPYLNPELTLKELSELSGITNRHLSQIINQNLNRNFYDFINHYRILAAQDYFRDPAKKHWTVLQVLYDVGFNSKSVFNTAFKKQTGLTPTSFRKQIQTPV